MKSVTQYIDELQNYQTNTNFYSPHFYLMGGKHKEKTLRQNEIEFNNIFFKLFNIATHIFKWEFKSDFTFNADIIENGLLINNGMCYFIDEMGHFILPARPTDSFNIYSLPIFVEVFGYNFNKKIKNDKQDKNGHGLYMYEYFTQYPLINYVYNYSYKISNKMRALDVLTQRLKSPFTVLADKKEIESIRKAFEDIFDNNDIILTNKKIDLSSGVELAQNNLHPQLVDAMKNSILFDYNQFLEIIGINTDPNPDKAERKLVDEINVNNMLISLNLNIRKNAREKFCEEIKKHYGTDIKVKVNYDIINDIKGVSDELVKDDENNKRKTKRTFKKDNTK